MAEAKLDSTQDQVLTVHESIEVVGEAVQGLLDSLGDNDSEAKDKVNEAQKLIDEARVLEEESEKKRKEAAGELRTTATDLEVQANELDPQTSTRRLNTSNVAAIALVSAALIGSAGYFGGCGDNEQQVGNQSAPTAETGPTGSIGQ